MSLSTTGFVVLVLSSSVAEEKLAQGKQLLNNLDEESAVAAFEEGLGSNPTPHERGQLALHLGLARLNLLEL